LVALTACSRESDAPPATRSVEQVETVPVVPSLPDVPETLEVLAPASEFNLSGAVFGPGLDGLGAATVVLVDLEGEEQALEVSSDGRFASPALPRGLYTLRIAAPAHQAKRLLGLVPGGPPLRIELAPVGGFAVRVVAEQVPVVGATCHLGAPGLFPSRSALSDSEGRCSFGELRSGRYELFVTAGALGAPLRDLDVVEPAPAEPAQVELCAAQDLQLLAVGPDGEPLRDVLVTVAHAPMHVQALSLVTPSSGALSFTGLVPGNYSVSARASGYLPFGPTTVYHPAKEPIRLQLDAGAFVAGRVVDPVGNDVAGAHLVARVEALDGTLWVLNRDKLSHLNRLVRPGGRSIGHGQTYFGTDNDGTFEIGGLPAGTITLEAWKDGWVPARVGVVVLEASSRADGIELAVKPGASLLGRVQDRQGGRVAGAEVRWRMPDSGVWGWREPIVTDESGDFALTGIADPIDLEIRAEGCARWTQLTAANPERQVFELEGLGGRLGGRVLGPDGALADASIVRQKGDDGLHCRGKTDANGGFELTGCAEEPTLFLVDAVGLAQGWFSAGPNDEVEVTLNVGVSLRGRVEDVHGRPLEGVVLSVEPVASSVGDGLVGVSMREFNGVIEVEHLPPGLVTLRLEAANYRPWSGERELLVGEPVDLGVVTLVPLARLSGFVLDAYGAPVSAAKVRSDGGSEALSDEDGRYQLEVSDERSRLSAVHWALGRGALDIEAGCGAGRCDVRLTEEVAREGWRELLAADGVTLVNEERGVVVSELASDSPWVTMGLQRGDFIEELDAAGGVVRELEVVREGRRRYVLRFE